MLPIDFYFDFASPYGFLAAMQIDALAERAGRTVRLATASRGMPRDGLFWELRIPLGWWAGEKNRLTVIDRHR